jgi:hypothetical protein
MNEFLNKEKKDQTVKTKFNYCVIGYKQNRFAISNGMGSIVDTAQGYGYKTRDSAYRAMNFKFNGGQQKYNREKMIYTKWKKSNPIHRDVFNDFEDWCETLAVEILSDEWSFAEIWERVEAKFEIQIPQVVKDFHTNHCYGNDFI